MDGFISYARKDRPLLKELLEPQFKAIALADKLQFWDDRLIMAGETWSTEIAAAIGRARYFVLVLSPDAIVSDYISKTELPAINARIAACNGLVIPVLLRDCLWEAFPEITSLQAIPDGRTHPEAITLWADKDQAATTMARQLRLAIQRHKSRFGGATP